MKHSIQTILIAFILSFKLMAQPSVSSFSPLSGPVSTAVTINGANFSTTANQNIVYFGSVKANVSAATSTSLTVTVPYGAAYQPVNVTTGGLTGYSAKPFTVTFSGGGFMDENSFKHIGDSAASLYPYTITSSDLDGDGNPDLITANKDSNNISVLRNNTTGGSIAFNYRVNLACTFNPYSVIAADIDGDGKQDIAVATFNGFSVFRNISTPGNIVFDPRIDFTSGIMGFFRDITTGDFDNDGKPDIALAEQASGPSFHVMSIFRNTSTIGSISFAPKTGLTSNTPLSSFCLRAADMDGDGKTDIPFTYSSQYVSVMRNTSTPGNLSFIPLPADIALPSTASPRGLAIADMENDGKPDMVIAEHFTDSISILKNNSTPGNISFSQRIAVNTGGSPRSLSVNDLDGDGKPDIAAVNAYFVLPIRPPVTVFKNTSSGGNISIAAPVYYSATPAPWSLALVDLNRDGKPDIATANSGGSPKVSFLRNKVGETLSLCAGGNSSITSNLDGAVYQWQVSTDSINFTNLADNINYTGTTTATLQLNTIPSSWYGRQYRCVVDGNNSTPVTIIFTNYWTGTVNTAWENPGNWSCGLLPDSNTDVIINAGTIILNSNTTIRSLDLRPTASLTVNPGYILTITH